MLNFNLLRIFYAAAKKNNFSAAADELVITQPTVSAQIRALENQYGTILFERMGKKVELNDSGRRLFKYAKRVFDLAAEIEELLHDISRIQEDIIRLGVGKSYGKYFISYLLSEFQKKFPSVKIKLKEGNSEDIYKSFSRYEIDFGLLGIGNNFIKKRGLESINIGCEEILLVVWPHHRLRNRKRVCFSDLKDEPIVLREKGSGVRDLIMRKFEQERIKPNIVVETESISTLIEFIREEEGVGFLPKFIAEKELTTGNLKAISFKKKFYIDAYLIFLKNAHLSFVKKAFLSFLVEYVSRISYPNFLLSNKTISRFCNLSTTSSDIR